MKLFSLLSIALVALPSTVALRGAKSNTSPPADERSLGSSYSYVKHDGACRKYENGNGSGKNGHEYDLYKKSRYPEVSKHWCQEKCDDRGSDCTGFEYREGSNGHCEIWNYKMKGYDEDRDGHYCYMKHYEGDSDDVDSDEEEDNDNDNDDGEDYDGYKHYEGACRADEDGNDPGDGSGKDYTRYKGKHYDWCKDKCDDTHDCKGFEYYYKHGKKHCEIWWSEIRSVKGGDSNKYFDCYIKND